MSERPLAITVDAVTKDFRLATEKRQTLKERVVNPRFDRSAKVFHALRDISFDVGRGEFFGIVGRNGSGKSTLLKCMAGIYKIDSGRIAIGGRLSTFIELGVGFNPDLAARDNIILNGIMLGLTPKEAADRVDDVIAFAELQDHADLKLKNYSSGMQVRLAFSVMTQVDADVLLIDEVLAVGDAAFQAKCFDVFRQLREAGKTIVLVTHDMAAVSRFCDRAVLLEDGAVVDIGDPDLVADRYLALNFERSLTGGEDIDPDNSDAAGSENADHAEAFEHIDDLPTRVVGGAFLSIAGEPVNHAKVDDTVVLVIDVQAREDLKGPAVEIQLHDELGQHVYGASTADAESPVSMLKAGSTWRVTVHVDLSLRPGAYRLSAVLTGGSSPAPLHRTHDLATLEITSLQPVLGIANLPTAVRWSDLGPGVA